MAKRNYVLDTSVYLTDAEAIFKFDNHDIFIPLKVLEEIDKHKKRQDSVGFHARKTIKHLEEKNICSYNFGDFSYIITGHCVESTCEIHFSSKSLRRFCIFIFPQNLPETLLNFIIPQNIPETSVNFNFPQNQKLNF